MLAFLRDNLAWMLLSLGLSITLWVVVTIRQNPDVTTTLAGVPITFRNAPKDLSWTSDATTVTVVLAGPSDVIAQMRPDRVHAIVDASKLTSGLVSLPVSVTSEDARARVQLVNPEQVYLRVEKIETKDVPVKINTSGSTPFGYNAGQPRATPPTVTVSGPTSLVDQTVQVVVNVPLDEARKPISDTFAPVAESSSNVKVEGVALNPEKVLVEVPVEQQLSYKTVPITPDIVGSPAFGYQVVGLQVDPQTVTVVGDPTVLANLTTLPTQPVSIDGATGDVAVKAVANLPQTVAFTRTQDLIVRVLISPVNGSKSILVAPQVQGLANGVAATVSPPNLTVTISGPVPVLVQTQPADIHATIYATGVYSGTFTVHPTVQVPNLVTLVGVQPDTVTLNLSAR